MKKLFSLATGLALVSLIACKSETEEIPYEAMEYNILFGGNMAGYQKSWKNDDGTYGYEYEFNDRGRGPHIEEVLELDDNGTIIRHELLGHNYFKDTVSEIFTVENGTARWVSTSEEGEADFDGVSMFSAMNSSFASSDVLVRRIIESEDKQVSLYPSGTLRLASEEEHTVDSLTLKLIELTGQSFTPTYAWVDENDRFFAYTSLWVNCIRKGYDSLGTKLYEIQQKKEKAYFKEQAANLIEEPEGAVLISNVSLFNANTGELEPGMNVLVEGNTISKVSAEAIEVTGEVQEIDGSGKSLLPGLFDMHTHISESDGLLHLAAGVTSVRDLANSDELPELAENFNSNALLGPRILVMSGFIDQAGPYAGPTGAIVESLEEGLEAIEEYHSKGYKQIKLYSSIDPSWVKPMAEKTHSLGMRLSGHIPSYMLAEDAVKAGYDEIQHSNMIALNFLSDTIDTRTPLRFSMIAEHTHKLDFESEEFTTFMDLLKEKGIVVDPTVSIFEGMLTTKAGEPDPSFAMILDRLPLSIQRGFYSGGLPMEEGKQEQYKESYDKLLGIVKQLYDNGITIVPGTDTMAGFGLHTELENYVRAGISAPEVLRIATIVSAEVCGASDKAGSIEEGKWADMILVEGDPTADISDIRKVALTIKDGKLYYPEKLYQAIGVSHYK